MEYSPPDVGPREALAAAHAIEAGQLVPGRVCAEFEDRFKRLTQAPDAMAVNSCTAALHLALLSHGIGPGDEVVTTPMTFCATANVIEHVGATTVFADVEPDTLNLDPEAVAAAITPRTKAILPVHFGGHPCDMDRLEPLAREHDLAIIEDAAHAFPSAYKGRPIGSRNTACFSFHATKNLTTGAGGMLTGPEDVVERACILARHGMEGGMEDYDVPVPGWKYDMHDAAAAVGLAQLDHLDAMQRRRREVWDRYMGAFRGVEALQLPADRPEVEHSRHMFLLRVGQDRDDVVRRLAEAGVPTSIHFIPVHTFSHYRRKYGHEPADFRVAWEAYQRMFCIPLHPGLTDEDVERVVGAVLGIAGATGS